uniref:Reverse transcriptase domain-containing protein n=1 Tax=Tanacetum cinerariifolium TaxID=118510 RepID=A0A699GVH4_TANCI|nr:reverse transcriptase domain-containing protein [Tanacetum cinerariifolium]
MRRACESRKERGNSQQRKGYDNFHGPALGTNNKTKDHLELLHGPRNFFLNTRRQQRLHPKIKNQMIPATTPLLGFNDKISWPLGKISLMVTLGDEEHSSNAMMNFMVVRSPSPYNGIIGRPGHLPAQGTYKRSQSSNPPRVSGSHRHDRRKPIQKGRMELWNLLKENLDIFAWKPADMTGIPSSIAKHRLNIRERCQLLRRKRRGHAPDRNKAIQEEVAKLVEAEIIREVHYHDWLSNPVMVKKHDGSWRIKSGSSDKATITPNTKRGSKPKKKASKPGQIPVQVCRKVTPFLQNSKKCVKKSDFQWTPEAEKAFQSMKKYIAELPMVTTPKSKEELTMYLCAAKEAISAVLLTKRDSWQIPVYFVSRALQAPEINYNPIEKVVLALVHAIRRLRRPRTSIRGQNLADFIVEKPDEEGPSAEVEHKETVPKPWILFTDGLSCLEGSGAGLILTSLEGEEFTYALRFKFDASNNEEEYKALISGMWIAEQMGGKNLTAKVDSRLIANQINGLYKAKEQSMTQYLEKAKSLIDSFKIFSIEQVPRSENKKADVLSKIASTSFAHLTKQVLVETLKRKSIEEREILVVVEEEGYCWMTPLIEYLTEGTLPAKTKKACTIKIKARQYTMINEVLYRNSFLEPWLQCVGPAQAKYVVKEIHEGSCSMHSGPRSVVEAKPVASITDSQVKKFVWDNIVCRFEIPGEIISDNEKQFRDNPFKDWCEKLNIKQRLGENNKNWVEEVPHVLWAHRTLIKTSNGDTLFSFTYGTKAVIPIEIGMPSLRCAKVNQAKNDEGILLNLDILEERREKVVIREARSKAKMKKYYNAKVRSTSFRPGDFVYRSNEASHAKESGKLGPKWEGPYEVIEALGKGAYKLRNSSEYILPRMWNVQDLKKCYL